MPTFRGSIHLGTKTAIVEKDDISNGSIVADKLADGSVTADKIVNRAVTSAKIDFGAVNTEHIGSLSITDAQIADGAVKASKIADGAVTGAKLANSSVGRDALSDGAVDKSKLFIPVEPLYIPTSYPEGTTTLTDSDIKAIFTSKGNIIGAIERKFLPFSDKTDCGTVIAVGTSLDSPYCIDFVYNGVGYHFVLTIANDDISGTLTKTTLFTADGSITTEKIATDAVNGSKIANGSIHSYHLYANDERNIFTLPGYESGTHELTNNDFTNIFGSKQRIITALANESLFFEDSDGSVESVLVVGSSNQNGSEYYYFEVTHKTVLYAFTLLVSNNDISGVLDVIPLEIHGRTNPVIVNSLPQANETLMGKVYLVKSDNNNSIYTKGSVLQTATNTHDWSNDGHGTLPNAPYNIFLLDSYDKHIKEKVIAEYPAGGVKLFNAIVVTPDPENVGLYDYNVANTKTVRLDELADMLLQLDDDKKVYAWVPNSTATNDTLKVYDATLQESNRYDKYIVIKEDNVYSWELLEKVESKATAEDVLSIFS